MAARLSSPHDSAPKVGMRLTENPSPEPISDDDLIRGFTLSLGASGRAEKTLDIYEKSVRMLSGFARDVGLPGLATMNREHVRHWLLSLHQRGNKPGAISVRYRAVNRFLKWAVSEGERDDNPMDYIDPPKIPDEIQPHYSPAEVQAVLKAIGKGRTLHEYRDRAIVLTLFDTGVRASELIGMKVEDVDWRERSILVTGKAGKQRRVSIGHMAAAAIDRYIRKRRDDSPYLWLASGQKFLTNNGLRMMLERSFRDGGVTFKGAHAFRRAFAMSYLESGGALDDLKELGGWEHYAMVSRYARASAANRAVKAHKKFSPGDRLNTTRSSSNRWTDTETRAIPGPSLLILYHLRAGLRCPGDVGDHGRSSRRRAFWHNLAWPPWYRTMSNNCSCRPVSAWGYTEPHNPRMLP